MKKIAPILFCLLLLITLCNCEKRSLSSQRTVLTSIAPYAYFVKKIAGDTVRTQVLVPSGANPHIYEPTPREAHEVGKAALWLRAGEAFEKKIAEVLREQNPHLKIVNMQDGIPLLDHCCECGHFHHEDETKDRHIWLSPKLAQIQAENIGKALMALSPENRELYAKNLEEFLRELRELDAAIEKELKPFEGQAILVSHAAFGYFCKEYHLSQLAIETEGKDPLPRQVSHVIAAAKKCRVRSVLTQPQYNNKGAELIAEKLHLPIFPIDPYSEDYINNLHYLARIVAGS